MAETNATGKVDKRYMSADRLAQICRVDGCDKFAEYKGVALCQKHYFRVRRTGSVDLQERPTRKVRIVMPGRGYVRVYAPAHPLADTAGYVAEHRKIVFDRIGFDLHSCEMCGAEVTWVTVHIDHIDNNPQNNDPKNLRPLCRPCNTFRDYPPQHTIKGQRPITYGGVTQTAEEWARDPRVKVAGHTITRRKERGMSDEDALFAPKKTHNGNTRKRKALEAAKC